MLPPESPSTVAYPPNAEIEFLTVISDKLFHMLLELQSKDSITGEGVSQTVEEKASKNRLQILHKMVCRLLVSSAGSLVSPVKAILYGFDLKLVMWENDPQPK